MTSPPVAGQIHLVVFIHGYEGASTDFDNCERVLIRKVQSETRTDETVTTLKLKANSGFGGTYDGIESGAVRLWKELTKRMQDLTKKFGSEIKALSVVGHSLGGLYARYLVRLLNDCFVFEAIEPRFFITLASPHLSTRRPQRGAFNVMFQSFGQIINKTTNEMFMEDDPIQPILYRMTEESFIQPLRQFKRRILYSNVINDFQVYFCTGSISVRNPYVKDGASMERSDAYSDITAWSLKNVRKRMQHDLIADGDIDKFAVGDPKAHLLRAMFLRLNDLLWERYEAVFSTLFAHEQIIFKRSFFAGSKVAKHLSDGILDYPSVAPTRKNSEDEEEDAYASADDGDSSSFNKTGTDNVGSATTLASL